MKIVLLCEGRTERSFKDSFKDFLDRTCRDNGYPPVGFETKQFYGRVTDCDEIVERLRIYGGRVDVAGVVALTDVYPDFRSAKEAKDHLNKCVKKSPCRKQFHAHAAQFDVEAWLLPFWDTICERAGVREKPPAENPEQVDDEHPPSWHLKRLYARKRKDYDKPNEAKNILKGHRIEDAAKRCPELQQLLDTLMKLCNPTAS